MKMLQAQSYTTTVPNLSFITPKKFASPRRVARTFSSNLPQSSFTCSHPDLVQPKPKLKPLPSPPSQRPQPSPPSVVELPARVYVGYAVYKEKAVLTVTPRPPEFILKDSLSFKISREGSLQLVFAPSAGPFQYDWNRKQIFSLSVGEIGSLINLGAMESCELFHDPFEGKSREDNVIKVLKVKPLHDGSGHMFNLSVQNKPENINENISIPVSKAEFAVFNSLFNFIMPCLIGWSAFGNSLKPEVYIASPKKKTMNGLDRAISAI